MNNKEDIEAVLELIEKSFPEDAQKISTIGFVNWHNLLNHAALENLDDKQVLFTALLILQLAQDNFRLKNESINNVIQQIKKVSFDESVDFLSGKDEDDKDS